MTDVPLIKRFLQHQSEFMAYLMAITRSFDASEEIFQNAAVVIMEKTDASIDDFRAWSKEVVRRQALHYLRKQVQSEKKIKPIEPNLLEQITRVFIEDNISDEWRARELSALQNCIAQISEAHREMLSSRYSAKDSFAEIGRRQGKTESAVQRTLSRIRKKLHDCVRSKVQLASP